MINKKIKYLKECSKYIPSCSQTLSKNPTQYVVGISPIAVKKAKGAYFWDIENKKYLDFVMALGPMIFGYSNPKINSAVKKQIDKGTVFSLPSELELSLAKMLKKVVPCAEMSRFALNGNDATSGAIRLARFITNRVHIAKCGYHGWQDWSISTKEGRNNGVPKIIRTMTHDFTYNQPESLEKIFADYPGQIAAVILEPASVEKPTNNFLKKIKSIAHKNGALLIFDELVTGFRWSLGGAGEYFKVVPDLACFGKAISGGFPLSVISGKSKYMKHMDEIFFSMTFSGYTPGLIAAITSISMMEELKNVQSYLHYLGNYLIKKANAIINQYSLPIKFVGFGPHPVMQVNTGDDLTDRIIKTFIYQEMNKAGILFCSSITISYAHKKSDIDRLLEKLDLAFAKIKSVGPFHNLKKMIKGEIIKPRSVRTIQ